MNYLFTELYNIENKDRKNEIYQCLYKNINNKHIDKVFIYHQDDLDIEISNDKVEYIELNNRLTYAEHFTTIINEFDEHVKYILCNNDIYFDDTISLLSQTERNISMTRWESKTKKIHKHNIKGGASQSQDVWITSRNIPSNLIKDSNFFLGVPGCDNKITGLMFKHGLDPINPSLDIKAWHLHDTELRTYTANDRVHGDYKFIEPSKIK